MSPPLVGGIKGMGINNLAKFLDSSPSPPTLSHQGRGGFYEASIFDARQIEIGEASE